MRKIFWDNPYQSRLETHVVAVEHHRVLFAETIAFSFSGGQESDRVSINGMSVIHSEIDGNLIYYTLPNGHNLTPNDEVVMEIE